MKMMFKNTPEGKRSIEKPRKRRLDDVENDLKKMGVRGWRKTAKATDTWKIILKEAMVLHGPHSQGREILQKANFKNRTQNFLYVFLLVIFWQGYQLTLLKRKMKCTRTW